MNCNLSEKYNFQYSLHYARQFMCFFLNMFQGIMITYRELMQKRHLGCLEYLIPSSQVGITCIEIYYNVLGERYQLVSGKAKYSIVSSEIDTRNVFKLCKDKINLFQCEFFRP